MNKEIELQKLNKLKGLIENTYNSSLSEFLIDNYLCFKEYLICNNVIKKFYQNETDELIEKQKINLYKKHVNAAFCFSENFEFLNELTIKFNELHQKYPLNLQLGFNEYRSVSYKELNYMIEDFIKSLGYDVYNIFINMVKDEYITFLNDDKYNFSGTCYNLAFFDNPRMVIKEYKNDFFMAHSFAHEMGHYYEYIRNKTNKIKNYFNLLVEVPSLLFQKLFDFYLIENGYYKNDGMDNLLVWKNNSIALNKINDVVNQAYFEDALLMDSASVGKLEIDDDFLKRIDTKTLQYIKYYGTNLRNYGYVLSDVIANNLLSKYLLNKKEGLKEIKDFITTMYQYSFSENIKKYALDMKSTEEEFKNLYNYQKKKFYL